MGTAPRAVWNVLLINRLGGPFDPDEWEEAKEEFIQRYTEDENARDTVLAAFTTGDFIKPPEIEVKDHHTRITEVNSYIKMLPSTINDDPLN